MLPLTTYAGLAASFCLLLASRYTADRAFHRLAPDQKIALMEGFPASFNSVRVLPLAGILGLLLFGVQRLRPPAVWPAFFVLWAFFFAYVGWTQRFVVARSRQLGAAETYLRARTRSGWPSAAAYGAFCFTPATLLQALPDPV